MVQRWIWLIASGPAALLVLLVAVELLIIKYNGQAVGVPDIPRDEQRFGRGQPLRYVVMGDSTAVGQGTDYASSFAYASAQYLAKRYDIRLLNTGVSGARAADVVTKQLDKAAGFRPDIVLLAIGANDVTHFTRAGALKQSLTDSISQLRRANPDVRIVITGSPDMGSIARFPLGAKQLADRRTRHLNQVFVLLTDTHDVILAPIAAKTGPAFRADTTLFAADKFHPNARGYALWIPVVNQALDAALNTSRAAALG